MEYKDKEEKVDPLAELHKEAMENFECAKDAWSTIHTQYTSDARFAAGDQWDPSSLKNRRQNNRSAVVYNKIPSNVKFIVNNARSCTPSIKVHPIADGASKNTAKVLDGIIKNIEYKSNAKSAYVKALETAVIGGIGCYRVLVEDVEEDGRPDITIKSIKDPTFFYIDPNTENEDFSDAKWCFLVKWIPKKTFEELYPEKDSSPINDANKDWYREDSVQVAEYWIKKDGKFCYYLISGDEVLEVNEKYPGKYLPFCFVTGTEILIDGSRSFKGIVRDIIDQQKMLNYAKSETADYITKSSKQQWLVESDMIAEYQEVWDSQNIESFNYLPFTSKNGLIPQRIEPLTPPSGFIETAKEADEDIRSTIGIRDPLQDIPSSQSGKAIQLQISQGNLGTFEFLDKLNASIRYCGKILVDLIPHFYNYPHIREIMGLDENVTPTPIMTVYEDNGEMVMHDLKQGYYSVTIDVGPSYESQRSEASDKLLELVSKYPEMMSLAGDLIVQNMDFKGAEELADRLRATIPPNILAASNPSNGDKNQMLSVMQNQMNDMMAQMQQMNELNQNLQAQLNQTLQQLNDKQADRELELTKKQMEIETQKALKMMEIRAKQEDSERSFMYNIEATTKAKEDDTNSKAYLDQVETQNNIDEYQAKKEIDGTQNITMILQ